MITYNEFKDETTRYRMVYRRAEEEASRLGVSASQWAVLNIVGDYEECDQSTIANEFGVSLPQITYLLTALKSKGLVTVKHQKSDKRHKLVSLTSKAKELL